MIILNNYMHNVEIWPSILVYTARFLNCFWPFPNIIHERVDGQKPSPRGVMQKSCSGIFCKIHVVESCF